MGYGETKEILPTLQPGSKISNSLFLAEEIYVVSGAERAAVYKTSTKEVFSLNKSGRNIVFRGVYDPDYLKQLQDLGILTDKSLTATETPQKENAPRRIDFVWFEITPNCNERCLHCYAECSPISSAAIESKSRLRFDDWRRAIVAAHDLSCVSGQFIGGEPDGTQRQQSVLLC